MCNCRLMRSDQCSTGFGTHLRWGWRRALVAHVREMDSVGAAPLQAPVAATREGPGVPPTGPALEMRPVEGPRIPSRGGYGSLMRGLHNALAEKYGHIRTGTTSTFAACTPAAIAQPFAQCACTAPAFGQVLGMLPGGGRLVGGVPAGSRATAACARF